MGLLSRVEHEAKAIYQELKGLPFSAYGGNSRGGYGMSGYGNLLGGNYFGNLPGTKYDYNEAAGVLWENPSAAACFVALTKAFAQARPILEKRTGKDWKQVDDHPLVEILNTPNQFYSGEKMFGVTLISTMSNGAAFWRLERNGANLPGEIWFEPPYGAGLGAGATGMAPNWDATDFIKNYTYFVDGKPYEINREDVVFFRHGLHPANPRLPWSPLRLAAREIATLNGASTYTGSILRNSAVPSGVLSMEGGGDITATRPTPQQAEDMKQKLKAGFRGDNVGEPFVSAAPWKWTPFNWSPAELAIDKIQQWPQGIVCALLATPEIVALLPTPEPPTYANLDASMRWWWDNTIIPLEDSFADDIETQLFPSFGLDSNDYRLTWDRSKVTALQEDENAKWTMITNAYKLGVIDRDEARVKIGYDSKPEYQGQFAAPAKDPAQPDDPQEAGAVPPVAAKSFNPNEPRDEDGKWAQGGSGAVSASAKKGVMRAGTDDEKKILGIPPAYTDLQMTDDPSADLIATAKSAKGKLQYYYSDVYKQRQAEAKFDRVPEAHKKLPETRAKWNKEIADGGKNAHEAMVLRLISQTGFRNGGLDGGGDEAAYGASSLLSSHAKVTGNRIDFSFPGKGNHLQEHSLVDPVIAAHIKKRQAENKETLFDTNDSKVRGYLKDTMGDFKVHDLRTRTASAMAAHYVGSLNKRKLTPTTEKALKKAKNAIADKVAKKLGDTRSVVLGSYISPRVWQDWEG